MCLQILRIFILFSFLLHNNVFAEGKTFGEIKKQLINKKVIILGSILEVKIGQKEDVFLEWFLAEGGTNIGYSKKIRSDISMAENAPYKYKGDEGVIVSVEIADSFLNKKESKDAFGDEINENAIIDPYLKVVVLLQNGKLLLAQNYYSTLTTNLLKNVSKFKNDENEMKKKITSLIGKTILPVGYSKIYKSSVSISDLTSVSKKKFYRLGDVPNFTPLKIIKAKYIKEEDSILIKISFSENRTGIVFQKFLRKDWAQDHSFLFKAAYHFLSEIPTTLTKKEIEAIKKGTIFRGMSKSALTYSWGYPQKTNDWGIGGKQLIYYDNVFVYIKDEIITDWQSL